MKNLLPSIRQDLRLRFFLFALALGISIGALVLLASYGISQELIRDLGTRTAKNQVLLDKARASEPLSREFALAEKLATHPAIISWMVNTEDSAAQAYAQQTLERYREAFRSKTYFAVPSITDEFFYADTAGVGETLKPTYKLAPDNPDDSWFYQTKKLPGVCHINVDFDREIKVTKVWFNCNVRLEGLPDVIGIVGTGINLNEFLNDLQRNQPEGVTAVYVDARGAIQAHPDIELIEQDALTKTGSLTNTIFSLLDDPDDQNLVRDLLKQAKENPDQAVTAAVAIDGEPHLLGLSYIPELSWVSVSIMDLRTVVFGTYFYPLIALVAFAVLLSVSLLALAINRGVISRIYALEMEVSAFARDKVPQAQPFADSSSDQLGRLQKSFGDMAKSVHQHTTELESLVASRTMELEALALKDPMTGVCNRRSFFDTADEESQRAKRTGGKTSVLMMDLDHFKSINDSYGHAMGDDVIIAFAKVCRDTIRNIDVLARFGGEEFALLLVDTDLENAAQVAERIRLSMGELTFNADQTPFTCTVSIGCSSWDAGIEDVEAALDRADKALYRAKSNGRNQVTV